MFLVGNFFGVIILGVLVFFDLFKLIVVLINVFCFVVVNFGIWDKFLFNILYLGVG